MSSVSKSRYWAGEIYAEHMNDEIINKITNTHLKVFLSPLHDRDVNPDGDQKKPHYHLLIQFDGPTTFNNVQNIFNNIVANGYVQAVASARGYFRYLCHLDNPEKAQYNPDEIRRFNGADPTELMSETDKIFIKFEINKVINEKNIIEYSDLCTFCMQEGYLDWYAIVVSSTMHFKALCDSKRYKEEKALKKILHQNN